MLQLSGPLSQGWGASFLNLENETNIEVDTQTFPTKIKLRTPTSGNIKIKLWKLKEKERIPSATKEKQVFIGKETHKISNRFF